MKLTVNLSLLLAVALFARGTEAPTPISAALQTEFQRHVQFAGAASCDDLSKWDCAACKSPLVKSTVVSHIINHQASAAHGYVATNSDLKAIIIAFRGSSDKVALGQDTMISKVDFAVVGNGAKVHSGFYKVYSAAKDEVFAAVTELLAKNSGYTITVTGHSLGAATASLIAIDLAKQHPDVTVNLYGISEPRGGNAVYAAAFGNQSNLNAYRLEQANDLVGQSPPKMLGYVHHATEYWIPKAFTNNIVKCDSAPGQESTQCANSVKGALNGKVHNNVLGYNFAGGCDGTK